MQVGARDGAVRPRDKNRRAQEGEARGGRAPVRGDHELPERASGDARRAE